MDRCTHRINRILAGILLAALWLSAMPTALAASFSAVVTSGSMTIYSDAKLSKKAGSLSQYTVVSVVEHSGSVAKISYGGKQGYAAVKDMARVDAISKSGVVNAATKVYAKANTQSAATKVSKGTKVNVILVKGDWALIERGGLGRFIPTQYLTIEGQETAAPTPTPTPTPKPTIDTSNAVPAVVAKAIVVYAEKSKSSTKIGSLSKGVQVNVLDADKTWAHIELRGNVGYCDASALKKVDAAAPTPTPTPTPKPTVDTSNAVPAVVTKAIVVYAEKSKSSTKIGSLSKGVQVNVLDSDKTWAHIELRGNVGYCDASALEVISGTPAQVAVSALKFYDAPNTKGTCLGVLSKGKQVSVLKVVDGWAYVAYKGNYGWCQASSLSAAASPTPTPDNYVHEQFDATVVVKGAKVYASESTSAQSKSVALGSTVHVQAYSPEWAVVTVSSVTGYMQISDLSRAAFDALEAGSSGNEVLELENALLNHGYFDDVPDKTYDASTADAVKLFQTDCGIDASGKANVAAQRILHSNSAPSSSLLSGSFVRNDKGTQVTRIQRRLYALDYLSKLTSADGAYGANTVTAVQLFQQANGLSVTGTADSATLRKLYSTGAVALPSGKVAPDSPTDSYVAPQVGSQRNNSPSIADSLASTTRRYSSGMSAAEKLEYVIYVGQNQLGKPYIYAANGPSAFDCTGFTCYCFKQIGISLQRTAYNQGYSDTYPKVELISQLKRGDLVYFNTVSDSDDSDHAGIYLGSGWFIHCSSGQGKVVVSTLASGYYNRVFSWGRRVFS